MPLNKNKPLRHNHAPFLGIKSGSVSIFPGYSFVSRVGLQSMRRIISSKAFIVDVEGSTSSHRQVNVTVGTALPPLARKLGAPDAAEEVLAFVLVLRIELDVTFLLQHHAVVFLFYALVPFRAFDDSLRLQYEFADLVLLSLFSSIDILPSKDATTAATADIRYGMSTCNQLTSVSFVRQGVR